MNQMQLVPKKDYVANRLVSGALQLARNTSLFLDETQLEQGQLDTTGEASRSREGAVLTEPTLTGVLPLFCFLCRCAQRHSPGQPDLMAEGRL